MPNKKISQFVINTNPTGDNIFPIVASGSTMGLPLSAITQFVILSSNSENVIAKTIDYNIQNIDTTTIFTNEGATTGITFSLPVAQRNLKYSFIVQNGNQLSIKAQTGNTIRFGLNISSSGGYVISSDIGSSITLIAINASEWISYNMQGGTWFTL